MAEGQTDREKYLESLSKNSDDQRFHLHPQIRLPLIMVTAGMFGAVSGFYSAAKSSSLRYLAENAHRLPKTMGGWYFYHKRKNYVLLQGGMSEAFKRGTKLSIVVGSYFGLEASIDYIRGRIDFLNSIAATGLAGVGYSAYNGLGKYQTINVMKTGFRLGLAFGLVQDTLIYFRGGNVWYLKSLGISSLSLPKEEQEGSTI